LKRLCGEEKGSLCRVFPQESETLRLLPRKKRIPLNKKGDKKKGIVADLTTCKGKRKKGPSARLGGTKRSQEGKEGGAPPFGNRDLPMTTSPTENLKGTARKELAPKEVPQRKRMGKPSISEGREKKKGIPPQRSLLFIGKKGLLFRGGKEERAWSS